MRFLILLLFLVGCQEDKPKIDPEIECRNFIRSWEYSQTSLVGSGTGYNGGYDLCDIDPTGAACPCAGRKTLPLSSGYTNYRLDTRIELLRKNVKEMEGIVRQNKNDKDIYLIKGFIKDYKEDIETLKKNKSYYKRFTDHYEGL